jgi:hypothetical protein
MSLLQEMEKYGLADCEFNRKELYHNKPVAIKGLTSYRLKGRYGFIMIGARSHEEAMREAKRSTPEPLRANLEVWDGKEYIYAKEDN